MLSLKGENLCGAGNGGQRDNGRKEGGRPRGRTSERLDHSVPLGAASTGKTRRVLRPPPDSEGAQSPRVRRCLGVNTTPGPRVVSQVFPVRTQAGCLTQGISVRPQACAQSWHRADRPSVNICRLSAGMRPDLGQLHHGPSATPWPMAIGKPLTPQMHFVFYQLWVKETFPWSSKGIKGQGGSSEGCKATWRGPVQRALTWPFWGHRGGSGESRFSLLLGPLSLGMFRAGPTGERTDVRAGSPSRAPHSALTREPGHARPPGSPLGETASFCGQTLAGGQGSNKSLVMCMFEMCWWRGRACLTRV